ncbi:transcription initiation factor IIB family protein [Halolamina litorea]|uniref:Transcription initiation factor IIB n=1 Tax=Halolamina litorea TaxID=1515593 RepID=A0ABD6BV92_9EURY|nr:transcription initiation factor IIB family protein [Halolamina litorea]
MSQRAIYGRSFDETDGQTLPAETTCPECDGALRTEGGETSCSVCGLIIDEYRIDHQGGVGGYVDDEETERTGPPLTFGRHDRGLSTTIGWNRDAKGNTLPAAKRRRLNRQRTQNRRAKWRSKAERNLGHACFEIARLVSALELPTVVRESASKTYRTAQQADLITGRSIESMAAGAVYAACRCGGFAVSASAVADVSVSSTDHVQHAYSVLNVELSLETPVIQPGSLIPKLATGCDCSPQVQHRALELATQAVDAGLANGRNPAGVAAGCLYTAVSEHDGVTTQAEIAAAAEVSVETVRSRYQELQDRV